MTKQEEAKEGRAQRDYNKGSWNVSDLKRQEMERDAFKGKWWDQ